MFYTCSARYLSAEEAPAFLEGDATQEDSRGAKFVHLAVKEDECLGPASQSLSLGGLQGEGSVDKVLEVRDALVQLVIELRFFLLNVHCFGLGGV